VIENNAVVHSEHTSGFDFAIHRLRFDLEAIDDVTIPRNNKGNVLRGAFGSIFKSLCCGPVCRTCRECPLNSCCPYAAIFEPSPPPGSERLSANQDIPRPFVFRPPEESKTRFTPSEMLSFELLLFGKASDYLAYFVVAFRELSERGFGVGRGRCRLRSIMTQEGLKRWKAVYTDGDQCVRPAAPSTTARELIAAPVQDVQEISIEFLTPTDLKHNGQQVRTPEFHHVIKRVRDRINAIGWFYAGAILDLDFAEFGKRAEAVQCIEAGTQWLDRERYSTRRHQRHPLSGFVGRAQFEHAGTWRCSAARGAPDEEGLKHVCPLRNVTRRGESGAVPHLPKRAIKSASTSSHGIAVSGSCR